MKAHTIKTWLEYFQQIWDGNKPFEVRENDRDYQEGDILVHREFHPKLQEFSERVIIARVLSVLHGPKFGIEKGYCVMGQQVLLRVDDAIKPNKGLGLNDPVMVERGFLQGVYDDLHSIYSITGWKNWSESGMPVHMDKLKDYLGIASS